MKRTDREAPEMGEPSSGASLMPTTNNEIAADHSPYEVLRNRNYRLFLIGVFIAVLGEQMANVAIGWELYDRTGSALALGFVGLVQMVPSIFLSLPAGHMTDQFDRKAIAIGSQVVLALSALGLTALSFFHGPLLLIYGCLFVIGAAIAFQGPATATLVPQLVPPEQFARAAAWDSSAWQLASVIGPALGGFVIAIAHRATPVYALNVVAALICALMLLLLRGRRQTAGSGERMTLNSLKEGLSFLRSSQIILAAITLDLFAVLFGGATTLLPVFAKDILHVGPTGLGWLRAAPSIGAVVMALGLAHIPPFKKAGRVLLLAVVGFGGATIVFGLSHSFWLSLAMLFLLGAFDNISVVIRSTLLLTRTPDAMRGRISSVNYLFITASNELGGFESGLVAQLLGPAIAVAGGGIGTILVVLCVALLWPEMRRLGALSEVVET